MYRTIWNVKNFRKWAPQKSILKWLAGRTVLTGLFIFIGQHFDIIHKEIRQLISWIPQGLIIILLRSSWGVIKLKLTSSEAFDPFQHRDNAEAIAMGRCEIKRASRYHSFAWHTLKRHPRSEGVWLLAGANFWQKVEITTPTFPFCRIRTGCAACSWKFHEGFHAYIKLLFAKSTN